MKSLGCFILGALTAVASGEGSTPSYADISKFALTSADLAGTSDTWKDINDIAFAVKALAPTLKSWNENAIYAEETSACPASLRNVDWATQAPYLRFVRGLVADCGGEDIGGCYRTAFDRLTNVGRRLWGAGFRSFVEDPQTADAFTSLCQSYAKPFQLDQKTTSGFCSIVRDILRSVRYSALKAREHSNAEGLVWSNAVFAEHGSVEVPILDKAKLDKIAHKVAKDEHEAAELTGVLQTAKVTEFIGPEQTPPAGGGPLSLETVRGRRLRRSILQLVDERHKVIAEELAVQWQNSPHHKWLVIYYLIEPMIVSAVSAC